MHRVIIRIDFMEMPNIAARVEAAVSEHFKRCSLGSHPIRTVHGGKAVARVRCQARGSKTREQVPQVDGQAPPLPWQRLRA